MRSSQVPNGPAHVLLVDLDAAQSHNAQKLRLAFTQDCQIVFACSEQEACAAMRTQAFDFIILDLATLAPQSETDAVESAIGRILKRAQSALVVALSQHGALTDAMMAMRAGAHECLCAPYSAHDIKSNIEALVQRHGKACATHLSATGQTDTHHGGLIGTSPQMQFVRTQIDQAAASDAPVFIAGENGTGKQLSAKVLHAASARADAPLIAINCATMGRELLEQELFGGAPGTHTSADGQCGAIERAEGGTLFIDEIGAMDISLQAKLLHLLQTQTTCRAGESMQRAANVRIVCATSTNPTHLIAQKRLREDLFYRLHVLPIYLPPLRQRAGDILPLATHFLHQISAEETKQFDGFSKEAEALLDAREWPGNIVQLQNLVRRIVVMSKGGTIGAQMIDSADFEAQAHRQALDKSKDQTPCILPMWQQEQKIIEDAVSHFDGNVSQAAMALEISPSTIYRKRQLWAQLAHNNNPPRFVA